MMPLMSSRPEQPIDQLAQQAAGSPPLSAVLANEIAQRLDLAIEAAQAAGERTQHYFRQRTLSPEVKEDGSPVTIADREAEQQIRRAIEGRFGDDGILGEEFGEKPGRSGFRWILDPIDGTKSFIRGVPLYGILIAVEHRGRSVVGIIHMPALGEMVYAGEGRHAWHIAPGETQPVRAHVSKVETLSDSLLCITSFSDAVKRHPAELMELARGCRSIRGWSDCYAHLLVATGRAEAAIEPLIQIWDVAPMIPIMREAGGAYTDWMGAEKAGSPTGLSSNGRIHETLLSRLRISTVPQPGVD